jgi:hypothetical protein
MDGPDQLRFEFEWEPAEGVSAPELAATWARLTISLGSEVLTQVEDARTGSPRRSIYVPLYPLAEWIAFNWWHLRHDKRPSYLPERDWSFRSRLRMPAHRSSWLTHHNTRAVGEGFPWPDLTLMPTGESVLLVWQRDRTFLPGWKVRFLTSGKAVVSHSSVETPMVELVDAVLTRLDEHYVRETPLAKEWRALQALDADEVEYCIAAARLGLDPFDVPLELADLILRSATELSPSLLNDFLDAATPARLPDEASWVEEHWKAVARSPRRTEGLPKLSDKVNGRPPWQQGYDDAYELRSALNVPPLEPFDVARLLAIEHTSRISRALQGLGARTSASGHQLVLAEPRSPEAKRFAAARGLWRFLRPAESNEFLLTSANTPIQKAERAFAAELLAPAAGIAKLLPSNDVEPVELEAIHPVSTHYAVSDWVVEYQLVNNVHREVEDLDLRRDV